MSELASLGLVNRRFKTNTYDAYHNLYVSSEQIIDNQPLNSNAITFNCPTSGNLIDFNEAYFSGAIQLQDSTTNNPYPSGTPISLNPCWYAIWASNFKITYNGIVLEQENNYPALTTFVSELGSRTKDYLISSQGMNEGFILDEAGETQYNQSGYPNKSQLQMGKSFFANYHVSFIVGGVIYSRPLVLVPIAATPTTGVLSFTPPTGVTVPANTQLTLTDNYGQILTVKTPTNVSGTVFTSSAVNVNGYCSVNVALSGASAINTLISFTTPYKVYISIAGVYYFSQQNNINVLSDIQTLNAVIVAGGTTTIGIASRIPFINVENGDLFGNVITSNVNRSGFWSRQSLTDNGRWFNFKVNFSDWISKYMRNSPPCMYGGDLTIEFAVTPASLSQMVQRGSAVNPPNIIAKDFRIVLRVPKLSDDSPRLKAISKFITSNQSIDIDWYGMDSQIVGNISKGTQVFAEPLNIAYKHVERLIFAFIPTNIYNTTSGTVNPCCSLVPQGGSENYNNPIINGYLSYLTKNIPENQSYGTLASDAQREFEMFLNFSNKEDSDGNGAVYNFQTFLTNYFYLVFDLSQIKRDTDSDIGTIANINLNFYNQFTEDTTVFAITQTRRRMVITGTNGTMFCKPSY